MALDREDTLKKAEKLLRQGRVDNAIAEYLRVVEDQPRDWNTANTLGDLYARANQPDKAVAQYARIADHFFEDGFYPKAAALYKKILKTRSRRGIGADAARRHLGAIGAAERRKDLLRRRGIAAPHPWRRARRRRDRRPPRVDRPVGRRRPDRGRSRRLPSRATLPAPRPGFDELHADLVEKGREAEATDALREAVRLNPADVEGRAVLANAALSAGDAEAARGYLDSATAGDDPALLLALAGVELRGGDLPRRARCFRRCSPSMQDARDEVVALGWTRANRTRMRRSSVSMWRSTRPSRRRNSNRPRACCRRSSNGSRRTSLRC